MDRLGEWSTRSTLAVVAAGSMMGCTAVSDSGGVATFSSGSLAGDSAALTALLVEEEGCVYAHAADGSQRWIPVLREQSHPMWKDGTLTFDGRSFESSADVVLGGGEAGSGKYAVPDACDSSPKWLTWSVEKSPTSKW